VSGTNLIANIIITAPTDYEISLASGSGYTNTLTLTQTAGTVSATTVYARLKTGLSKASYSESISLASTNATTKNIVCNGSVNAAISAINSTLTPTTATITADGSSIQILIVQAKDADGNLASTNGLTGNWYHRIGNRQWRWNVFCNCNSTNCSW
jgi:hypothetical protein